MRRLAEEVTTAVGDGTEPRYWPIVQYGALGDCRTAALVAPNGSIDWCCLPHFGSPAVFLRLLDADKGGYFQIRPAGQSQAAMSYLPGTNILETIFTTTSGQLRLVDFMPVRKRMRGHPGCASWSSACPCARPRRWRCWSARPATTSPPRTASRGWQRVGRAVSSWS